MAGFWERKFQLAQGPAAFWEKGEREVRAGKDKQGTPGPSAFRAFFF